MNLTSKRFASKPYVSQYGYVEFWRKGVHTYMKRIEKSNWIIHIIMCVLTLGSIFYALMVCSIGTPLYGFFRQLSLAFGWSLLLMRIVYLQYIIFGLIAIFTIIKYIISIKNKEIIIRNIWIDVVLWTITIFELIYLESAFGAIVSF